MPTTTVQKMIGAMIILISLMKPSPSGFIAVAGLGIEMPEQDADDDRDDHLEVERFVERLAGSGHLNLLGLRSSGCIDVSTTRRLPGLRSVRCQSSTRLLRAAARRRRPRRRAVMLTMRRTVDDGVMMCTGLRRAEQDAADGDAAAGGHPQRVVGDVGRVDVRHDQQVGVRRRAASPGTRRRGSPFDSAESARISPSTARSGRRRDDQLERIAHLLRRRRVGAAEARVRQQRDAAA